MKLEHIAINVPDPVKMAEWYVEHCKMRIVLKIDLPPFTRFLADQEGNTCIEIYQNQSAPMPDYESQSPLVYHHAFSVENLDNAKNALIEAGSSFVEEINFSNGTSLIMLRDPWGIPLQLVKRTDSWY